MYLDFNHIHMFLEKDSILVHDIDNIDIHVCLTFYR